MLLCSLRIWWKFCFKTKHTHQKALHCFLFSSLKALWFFHCKLIFAQMYHFLPSWCTDTPAAAQSRQTMMSPCVGEDNGGDGSPVVTKEHPSWPAFLGWPLALEGRKINTGLTALSTKNIYISMYTNVCPQKARNMLLVWTLQTHPLCWNPSLDLRLSGWTTSLVSSIVGAAGFRLYIMGELCSADSGTSAASAWSLGLEGALGLGHTTKYPPAPNAFILVCIHWELGRKDGDFAVAAK